MGPDLGAAQKNSELCIAHLFYAAIKAGEIAISAGTAAGMSMLRQGRDKRPPEPVEVPISLARALTFAI
jgi:hypothetical protein